MSKVVDERIVSMKFDNENFEKNVSKSMKTLDGLKKKLDTTDQTEALERLGKTANQLDFSGIERSVQELSDRFSTMGIVGMTAIANITTAAMNLAKNLSSKVWNLIYTGGMARASKIENAKFQLAGLGIEYDKIADAIDYAVTNTAYGLDAAAQAAAQLSSAGLDYEKVIYTHEKDNKELTEMSMALRAVSGVAAQTQSDYAQVARYFQDVANAGKVTGATLTYMTQVLNLPVSQNLAEGLNAIADGSYEASEAVRANAKKLVGGTKLAAEQVSDLCSKGLIDFDTFATIMFDKYADHAVDANKTLEGVKANIRSAFAKIGAEFIEPIIRNEGELVGLLDTFRAKVNELKKELAPFLKRAAEFTNGILTDLNTILKDVDFKGIAPDPATVEWVLYFFTQIKDFASSVLEPIHRGLKNVHATMYALNTDTTKMLPHLQTVFRELSKFVKDLKPTNKQATDIKHIVEGIASVFDILWKTVKAIITPFGQIFGMVDGLGGSILELAGSWGKWLFNLDKSLTKMGVFEEISRRVSNAINAIKDNLISNGSFVDDFWVSYYEGGEGFAGVLEFIFDKLADVVRTVVRVFESLTGLNIEDKLSKVVSFIQMLRDAIVDFVYSIQSKMPTLDSFKKFFENLNIDTSGFDESIKKFKESFDPITKGSEIIKNALEIIASVLTTVWKLIGPILSTIGSLLKKAFDEIIGVLNNGQLGEAIKNMSLAFVVYQLRKLAVLFKKVLSYTKLVDWKSIPNLIQELTSKANTFFSEFQKHYSEGNYLLKLAGAVLMLAFAMTMLADLDTEKLGASIGTVLLLIGALASVSKKLSMFGGIADISPLTKMATAILIISFAIKNLAKVEPDRLAAASFAIGILLFELQLIAGFLSSRKQEYMTKGMSGLIAMAIAVRILAGAAKKLGEIPIDQLKQAGVAITVLMGLMIGFIKLTQSSVINKKGEFKKATTADHMISIGLGLVALAGALKIFASAAKDFAEIEQGFDQAMSALVVLLVGLGAFVRATRGSKGMISVGLGMIALAAAMKIFASAASDFAELDWEQLGRAGSAFTVILGLVTAFQKLAKINKTSFGGFSKEGGIFKSIFGSSSSQSMISLGIGLIAIAGAMKIFASAATVFGNLDWEQLGKAGSAMAGILVLTTLFSRFGKGFNLLALSTSLILLSVGLTMMIPAIEAFAHLSINGMLMSLIEIAGVITLLAAGAKYTAKLIPAMFSLAAAIGVFGLALMALGSGLTILSAGIGAAALSLPQIITMVKDIIVGVIDALIEAVPKIVTLIVTTIDSVITAVKEYVPKWAEETLQFILQIITVLRTYIPEILDAVIGFFADLFSAISDRLKTTMNKDMLMEAVSFLTELLIAIAAASYIVSKSLGGVIGILAVVASLIVLCGYLEELNPDTLVPILDSLSTCMIKLSAALWIISKVPVAFALEGILGLDALIADLAIILAALGGLSRIEGFNELIADGGGVLGQIGTALGTFVGNIVGAFAEGVTSGLPGIGKNLSSFMENAETFIDGAKKIDNDVVDGISNLSSVILKLTGAELLDGLTSWLTGGNTLSSFGEELASFGPYFNTFYESIKSVKPSIVNASANCIGALAAFAQDIPNEGGLVSIFTGDNTLEDFGKQLVAFGPLMKQYADSVKDLDIMAVTKSVAAASILSALANGLPEVGGLKSWFFGDNSMETFGTQISAFGSALKTYAEDVGGITEDSVVGSVSAGSMIADLAKSIADIDTEGFMGWFNGSLDLGTFGTQIALFGEGLSAYAKKVEGIGEDDVTASLSAATMLADFALKLSDIHTEGLKGWLDGTVDIGTFGTQIGNFGTAMVAFADSTKDSDFSKTTDIVTAANDLMSLSLRLMTYDTANLVDFGSNVSSFAEGIATIGSDSLDGFLSAFTNSSETVSAALDTMFVTMKNIFIKQNGQFKVYGKTLLMNFRDGMNLSSYYIKTTADGIVSTLIKVFSDNITKDKFYNYGRYVSLGFAEGMESELHRIRNAAQAMVDAAANATIAKAEIASPSHLFARIASWIPKGAAVGITDNIGYVEKASESMVDVMSEAIAKVVETVDSDMDMSPTITPVVDLSNVQNGVEKANKLFNNSIAFTAMNASKASLTKNVPYSGGDSNNSSNVVNNYFTQNNTSPKALSTSEIYRQTKSIFSRSKGAVNAI